ncbi:NAD(P)-binding protein [Flavobacterium sp. Arc3]|uniref:NAD(P)-binding protein n=1 Tax=Flavobacterium sp. Arc3 TaxID=3046686 RepID=UPI00352E34CA
MKRFPLLGAGLSGLLTAFRLQNKGLYIEIIEARNRICGRLHTIYSNTAQVERGTT